MKDGQRNSDIDFLFKQFNVRNSFTIDDSKVKKWKKDSMLGKRGSENVEEELEMSLITDLKGLRKHEKEKEEEEKKKKYVMSQNQQILEKEEKSRRSYQRNQKKKYISDFFGDEGNQPKVKRY